MSKNGNNQIAFTLIKLLLSFFRLEFIFICLKDTKAFSFVPGCDFLDFN